MIILILLHFKVWTYNSKNMTIEEALYQAKI